MAYADVSDIETRWRTLTSEEQTRAAVLLEDASAVLESLVDINPADTGQEALLNMVCCNMVIRKLDAATQADVSNMSMTAGPYTQSFTYAAGAGILMPSRMERKLLGIGGKGRALEAAISGWYGANDD